MGTPENKISDLVDIVKSWIPRRSEPANLSRDFWMPDQSCRVCYDCDSQFTVFNRRHHCRLCGRVFCAKCTANSIPAPSDEPRTGREDWDRIRVCNYCFKLWEQRIVDNENSVASPGLSPSLSAASLASSHNSSSSTVGSTPYSTGPYQHVAYSSALSPRQSIQMDSTTTEPHNATSGRSLSRDAFYISQNQLEYCMDSIRSDDEDDDYSVYRSVSDRRDFSNPDDYHAPAPHHEIRNIYRPHEVHNIGTHTDAESISSTQLLDSFDPQGPDRIKNVEEEGYGRDGDECEGEAPSYEVEGTDAEPVDFESNGLLWLPPEPENEEDEREGVLFDDEDDDEGAPGEWGYSRPSNSFGSGEYRRDKSTDEHRKAMKNVVEGHFRALVSQLLQVENLTVSDQDEENWLEIITSLSWEAATLLKPDTSKGGGMDPGGYVKIKCIACGRRSESMVVKGVVCKKNVAHRRMMSKRDKPRFMILAGALEYQRISNLLSSVDTLLQQEMDHLKMAVARIDQHHPDVLLVEKSVSRYAQDYLLAKDISLVLNIKRPLLERIARCTGSQIIPSIDHLSSQKLGHCDLFHVEKFLEEHGSAGQGGKKLTKTLMFFEGCPKPLGCTILLKGANGDELKKVKHVLQFGVFAAYHLALETSFLADEGATLPELPLKSPITVALPDKPSSIDRSISTIPGFIVPGTGKPSVVWPNGEETKSDKGTKELQKFDKSVTSDTVLSTNIDAGCMFQDVSAANLYKDPSFRNMLMKPALSSNEHSSFPISFTSLRQDASSPCHFKLSSDYVNGVANNVEVADPFRENPLDKKDGFSGRDFPTSFRTSMAMEQYVGIGNNFRANSSKQDGNDPIEVIVSSKEEFPPSPSDHQSILVSLSTRCVWKGTVCDRAHLLRIKYYGSFDKPLGRFLRDHLFDQDFRCHSCELPSEAHVHCYTHRQGSLTISVKKLSEFLLPGEREGKIWMWHRCLRCPRTNGFPPATRRIVMSDAAWGLSFGKFLELSFSNHAAASRVASCGHSLHRDCLRFYGFGRKVACFRYASIDVHSVCLPPAKVEFAYDNQEWIQKEATEVQQRAEFLFNEVYNALQRILEKLLGAVSKDADMTADESSRLRIAELSGLLQKEKEEFEESLQKILLREVKVGQPAVDILEINTLRRQILFHSYVWDQRLIFAATSSKTSLDGQKNSIPKVKDKHFESVDKLANTELTSKLANVFSSSDSYLVDKNSGENLNQGEANNQFSQPSDCKGRDIDLDINLRKEAERSLSSSANIDECIDPLDSGKVEPKARTEVEFPLVENLSETLDAAWTGKGQTEGKTPTENGCSVPGSHTRKISSKSEIENCVPYSAGIEAISSLSSGPTVRGPQNTQNSTSIAGVPFTDFHNSFKRNSLLNVQQHGIDEYSPVYISSFRELERQTGVRLLLPVGVNDTVVPVYDDEPTSIIAYALVSSDYHVQMSELEKSKDTGDSSVSSSLLDSVNLLSVNSLDDSSSETYKSLGSLDESLLSVSGSQSSLGLDPLVYTKNLHARVSFTDDSPLGKVKYTVTCYYAKRFEALRRTCCPSELDFIRSLSRCKKWGAQGGKSNVFFAKTLDDRFIIKQVTKTELESFIKFGAAYFKYLSESISTRSPTCLAKILGIYQVPSKHLKGGKESKMDVLVMENLMFRRNVTRLYDLKGSCRSRYNPDTSGSNKVLLDQNLIEAMPTSPIFVGNKAKRLLERAVWNDTSFLASVDVMDYSLLVGIDEEKHELVLGIIDFMRQYTWDKHLETWVKTSGILGRSKNTTPTVISPQQYKKRFRKAMTAYFLMVPDQWSPTKIITSGSQSDLCEENSQSGTPLVDTAKPLTCTFQDVS